MHRLGTQFVSAVHAFTYIPYCTFIWTARIETKVSFQSLKTGKFLDWIKLAKGQIRENDLTARIIRENDFYNGFFMCRIYVFFTGT